MIILHIHRSDMREGGGQTLALSPWGPLGQLAYHSRKIADRVSPTVCSDKPRYSLMDPGRSLGQHPVSSRQTRGCVTQNRTTTQEGTP